MTLMLKVLLLFIYLFITSCTGNESLQLKYSHINWKCFDYQLNPDMSLKYFNAKKIVNKRFQTIILENRYLKVTLLPEYGGRILSILYKPTGHEQLYQNPVGTLFASGGKSFYYDYMMVYGGIFPTFPEPEHGKTWQLPWKTEVIENTKDKITVQMSFLDDIDPNQSVPGIFVNGKTGIHCVETVSLYKDRTYIEMGIELSNTQNKAVDYEYWTCTTLAPGSVPGNTIATESAKIVAPLKKVSSDMSWYWINTIEKRVNATDMIYEYKNLAWFTNWVSMGICYAYPEMEDNWWGVINTKELEGIIRVADNKENTPGLKFWTWGYQQSLNIKPEKLPGNSVRPYIELWAGNSRHFFEKAQMTAYQVKKWKEIYLTVYGLSDVTKANENGSVYLNYTNSSLEGQYQFDAVVFPSSPNATFKVVLTLSGKTNKLLLEKEFSGSNGKATVFSVISPVLIDKQQQEFLFRMESANGDKLIEAGIPIKP